jgi:predicted  nucleic acid-binding Zn-ribbon protein
MNYIADLPQTLEERVEELDRKVAVLSARVLDLRPRRKDWRLTVGSVTDDGMAREAERLGREYRQEQARQNSRPLASIGKTCGRSRVGRQ